MDVISLKKYIHNNDKIPFILNRIGCGNIKYNSNRESYSASQKNGDNPMGVVIDNNEHLNYTSFSRGVTYSDNKDLISLIEDTNKISFIEAIKYLHNILNLDYKFSKPTKQEKTFDPLEIFKKVKKTYKVNVSDIQVLDEDVLSDYSPILHYNWMCEGIMPWTAKKFGIGYSYRRSRIIIPIRYWLDGSFVGINARTTIDNYKELGIKKYYLTPTYKKSLNLYGLWENYDSIKKAGYVVITESEKSVLKRDSLVDPTCVALSGHTISDEQAAILIGLNVEIIIALDKDISIDEVRNNCEKFYGIRKVSYIYDKYDLLGEKDSPADAKNKIYTYLFKYRTTYDRLEHNNYLESLKINRGEYVRTEN